MGNLILYYITCEKAGLLKINGNIAGSTKETLCALSPKTSEVFLEWQPFSREYLPLCVCLEFKNGELIKNDIDSSVHVLIYSGKLIEIIISPAKSRYPLMPPHGHFDLPYKKDGEDYVFRAYHDGGNIVCIEKIMDMQIKMLSYTDIKLERCTKGIFQNGDQLLLFASDGENTMLISHTDKAEISGVYKAAAEVTEKALILTETLPDYAARKRRITFTQGKFLSEFSPFERSALKKDEDVAMALMFCVKFGLSSDAERLLAPDIPRGTAARLPEFFGDFDRFIIPHISSKCEKGTVCIALLKDMCKNISMAKPFFFKISGGNIINISD